MSRRYGSNDYPEHLNPFSDECANGNAATFPARNKKNKRSHSFSRTLKGFTSTLRRSFRANAKPKLKNENDHDQDGAYNGDVQYRRTAVPSTAARHTITAASYRKPIDVDIRHRPSQTLYYSPALPRSRFQERLAKSATLQREKVPVNDDKSNNPFDNSLPSEKHPEDKQPQIRRRKKKKAPMPPQFETINETDSTYLQVPSSTYNSKWSLTSEDTDASYSTYATSEYSEDEGFATHEENAEVHQKIQDFNREMQKLTDDTNNNNIIFMKEDGDTENIAETTECIVEIIHKEVPPVVISYIDASDNEETSKEVETKAEGEQEHEGHSEKCSSIDEYKVNSDSCDAIITTEDQGEAVERKSDNATSNDNSCDTDDAKLRSSKSFEEMENKVVVETKFLYISSSGDITNKDHANGTVSTCSPVPKLRRNKLTRNELLGKEELTEE